MELPRLDLKNPTKHGFDEESVESLLEEMSIHAGEIQHHLLERILSKNFKTEYLSKFLPHDQVYDANVLEHFFKKNVPLVEYKHLLPYIQRIVNGESHLIVSADPILELICSTGTSGGKQKWFPKTAQDLSLTSSFHKFGRYILNKHIVDEQPPHGGKRMFLYFLAPDITTPGHLVVRSAITSLIRNNLTQNSSLNPSFTTSPPEVTMCEDVKQSMYSHLLCGLVQRESVMIIGTTFAAGFLRVIKFLEQHWQELCCNIREGRISDWIDDLKCRQAVSCILSRPMPDLADAIFEECEKKPWEGIVKSLWPRTKCIEVVTTGSMAQYIPKLEFHCGGLPIVSLFYAASEGCFGINIKPLSDPYDVSYCLVPWMAYYEFLPVDPIIEDDGDDHHNDFSFKTKPDLIEENEADDGVKTGAIVDFVNVKIGQHYELVVTTFSGLNRYRLGDILMVKGFHKNAPQFKFVQRKNVILSILSDKTTEEDLLNAISKAIHNLLEPLGFSLTDYTSYADSLSFPGHYILFWEFENHAECAHYNKFVEMLKECCNLVDGSLDETYRDWRIRKAIGPLEIRVVKQGTFDALMDFMLSCQKSTSFSQYKTPKCISSKDAIQLLNSMVIATFFSE